MVSSHEKRRRMLARLASFVLLAPLATGGIACARDGSFDMGKDEQGKKQGKKKDKKKDDEGVRGAARAGLVVDPTPFAERNGKDVYNASGVVALGDSKFLFCDNNVNDALLELTLAPDGRQAGPLVRRPLEGLPPGSIDDMEDMAIAEENGRRYVFVTSSMAIRQKKGKSEASPSGLLRVRVEPGGRLVAENMAGIREWLVGAFPQIAGAAKAGPDQGGLNVEGLAWDPRSRTLLFGVRTPVPGGRPLVLPVRVKDMAGAWAPSNLEAGAPLQIALDGGGAGQGIRALAYDEPRGGYLVVTGNATSGTDVPFSVYAWDGAGAARRLDVGFAGAAKVEGVTRGAVGGKGAHVLVDDAGGFAVLWDENPALR